MKFYKFNNGDYSYYALIGSSNEEKAKEFYVESVADIEGKEKGSKPIELSKEDTFKEIIGYYNITEKYIISDTQKRFNKAVMEENNTLFAIDKCLN